MRAKFKIKNLKSVPLLRLQTAWNFAQVGIFIFPWIPILGALGIFLGLVGTYKQQYRTIIQHPLNRGFAIFAIWLVINACFAYNRTEAFLGLGNFFPFLVFFAAYSTLIQTPAQLRQISWILVITSVPVVIVGLGQLFLGWASPVQWQSLVGWTLEPGGNPTGRMASVFMYANILAAYLTVVFILGLGLLIENWAIPHPQPLSVEQRGEVRKGAEEQRGRGAEGQRSRGAEEQRGRGAEGQRRGIFALSPRALFLSVAVMGNAIALILTNSRNGWIVVAIASLAFALYLGWRWLVALVAAVAGGILWSAFGPDPVRQWLRTIVPAYFWARLTDQLHPDRPVALMRVTQWQFVASMTQQRPWTGWGLRNFTPLYQEQMQIWLGHPHNLFLMLTAEIGIPATLFFCGLVGWVMGQSILLLHHWPGNNQDKFIFLSYLIAFFGLTLFNTVDVTLFDLRVNTVGWLLLAAISGISVKNART